MKQQIGGGVLGRRILAALVLNGISVAQLAEEIGVTYVAAYCWTRGTRIPRALTLMRIAEILHVPIGDLFGAAADSGKISRRRRNSPDKPRVRTTRKKRRA